jgi:eukaryotic-like serine/threonine-protein kinase
VPNCPSCSRPVGADSQYCAQCGAVLSTSPDATVTAALGHRTAASLSSPDPATSGRFVPGTLLANRYRIVAMLGRGGMGEVYRADDLTLGQSVALKFLPQDLIADPERLARFRSEVRTAREVSHPNVCRVYDIGEAGGLQFLSMEYVTGEDLASLLRRIGRFPQDKGVEVARQICAGLQAAHDRGVVHRDLKPANVMLDEHGDVRLADFGLAGAADRPQHGFAGTPAYMAPEQFDGRDSGVRSDIYALGLVLYEIFTGQRMFADATFVELAQAHRERPASSASRLVPDLDPAIERAIQRCLSKDPAARPASALTIAASLPGGDPLAAALARGETPSPSLVAAAGGEGLARPALLIGCLVVVIAGVATFGWASRFTHLLSVAPMPRSPDVLRDRASAIVHELGYDAPAVDSAAGFVLSDFVLHLVREPQPGWPWSAAASGRPSAVLFWYRQSPEPLVANRFWSGGRIRVSDPLPTVAGAMSLQLDTHGRLFSFAAVPEAEHRGTGPTEVRWEPLFAAAGLDSAKFTPVDATLTPPVFADRRAAWDGTYPDNPSVPIRIDAAALGVRPVYFFVREPWTAPGALPTDIRSFGGVIWLMLLFLLLALAGAALASRNLRLGRVDVTGATRLAVTLFLLRVGGSALTADYPASGPESIKLITLLLAEALFLAALIWIGYAALEPHVRRRWPEVLISWTRLISGRWRDPRVGWDVLLGVTMALTILVAIEAADLINVRVGRIASLSVSSPETLDGWRFLLGRLLDRPTGAVLIAFSLLLLLLVTTIFVRSRKLAIGIVVAAFLGPQVADGGVPVASVVVAVVVITAAVVMLARAGVLPLIVSLICGPALDDQPLTIDSSVWYAPYGWFVAACVIGLAVYGFRVGRAGRPLLSRPLLD